MTALLKRLVPLCTALFSVVWIIYGFAAHSVWDSVRGPQSGFFPTLVAALLLVVSVIAVIQAESEPLPVFRADHFLLIGTIAAMYVMILAVGMFPTVLAFLIAWLRWLEKYPWKTTLTVAAVICAIVFGVFVLWLGVMFPKGLVFDALSGG